MKQFEIGQLDNKPIYMVIPETNMDVKELGEGVHQAWKYDGAYVAPGQMMQKIMKNNLKNKVSFNKDLKRVAHLVHKERLEKANKEIIETLEKSLKDVQNNQEIHPMQKAQHVRILKDKIAEIKGQKKDSIDIYGKAQYSYEEIRQYQQQTEAYLKNHRTAYTDFKFDLSDLPDSELEAEINRRRSAKNSADKK